jgi:hypothetical protein
VLVIKSELFTQLLKIMSTPKRGIIATIVNFAANVYLTFFVGVGLAVLLHLSGLGIGFFPRWVLSVGVVSLVAAIVIAGKTGDPRGLAFLAVGFIAPLLTLGMGEIIAPTAGVDIETVDPMTRARFELMHLMVILLPMFGCASSILLPLLSHKNK